MLERIRRLYEDYEAEFARLEANRPMGAGMFGLGGGPRDYPCHQQFARELEELLRQTGGIAPEEAREILEHVYFSPSGRRQDAVGWMMTAVHGMTVELVQRLSREDAAGLLARYQRTYPRREWLPVQKKVVSALKARGKG